MAPARKERRMRGRVLLGYMAGERVFWTGLGGV